MPDAVVATFATLARSCFFTSLTTALGFVGLVATRNPLVYEFGIVTGLAVIAAFGVTSTLLPALLSFASDLGPDEPLGERLGRSVVSRIEATLRIHPGWPNWVFAVLLGLGLALGGGLRVHALLIDDLKDGDPILEELRWIEDAGFGVFQVNVFLTNGDGPGHSAEMLRWIRELQAFGEADPVVLGSVGLPQFVDELGAAYGSVPEAGVAGSGEERTSATVRSTEEVAELLFLSELQELDALEDVYLREGGAGQVVFFVRDAGSSALSPFLLGLEDQLTTLPPPRGSATLTGTVKLSQVLWDQMVSRFLPGVAFSIVLVWMAMSWMFRSARLGLVAVVPNLFPLVMLLGLMRLGGFDLKPTTLIVFAIAFGLVADDTIHFLGALVRNVRSSAEVDRVLAETLRKVGSALVVVTVVVVCGFSVLMLSRFQVLFLVGLLTSSAAILALAADLVGFPAFLRAVARRPAIRSLLMRSPR